MLVGSVLLYGAELWGWGRSTLASREGVNASSKDFLGVGRLHPLDMN